MIMDFDFNTKKLLYKAIQDHFLTITVAHYFTNPNLSNFAIIRHDVDRNITRALQLASFEKELDISASYYFRYPGTFSPKIIQLIASMGHEIGYHYEVLSKSDGNPRHAISLFSQEIKEFRNICPIKTICVHGSPLSRYDSRDLWQNYDFRDFNILGDASFSIKNIPYYSDTGRTWSGRNTYRETDTEYSEYISVETTNDLIDLIRNKTPKHLYLSIHPERWTNNTLPWISQYLTDVVTSSGKKVIMTLRK
jgi:hypothetical protein